MSEPVVSSADGFDEAAAAKLWALLPAVYRQADSDVLDGTGPLRTLLDRVAVQLGDVRRGIDRLWEDQSVETGADWVVPYLAALLDTNLVPSMDARGRRLDVANTIYYRRRKGTVALLEQLAADVTGWESHVVEFFRRLGRNRHLLDPALGRPADEPDRAAARRLQRVSGLVGPLTGTPLGGRADLRHPVGAADAHGPFDEYAHRADVRIGRGALGWHGIAKIGVFLWQAADIAVDRATPVPVAGCPDHYAADPTGRQLGLWQADDRPATGYGERWAPLAQWQVPGPLTQGLADAVAVAGQTPVPRGAYPDPGASFQPRSFAVRPLGAVDPVDPHDVKLWPEVGRFAVPGGTGPVEVAYHYGLFSRIGAGPYDRRRVGAAPASDPAPVREVPGGTPTDLNNALAALGPTGTVVVTDGLTSTAVAPVGSVAVPVEAVTVRARDQRRAVIRLAPGAGPWVFTGSPAGAEPTARLRLEGVLFSGADIVLRGGFAEVVVACTTLDPGTSGALRTPATVWQPAVDGRDLSATRLIVEGTVRSLVVDRSITGPIRTRAHGVVELLCATDSVIQGLPADTGGLLSPAAVDDPTELFRLLHHRRDPLTAWLAGKLGAAASAAVAGYTDGAPVADGDLAAVVADLNTVLGAPLWDPARFAQRQVPAAVVTRAQAGPTGAELVAVNRELLGYAFPSELSGAALVCAAGLARLNRVTLLGRAHLHRLECSESILDDVVVVDDTQDGCVRFSACSTGSVLPRRYESVEVRPGAPLFASRRFGEAGYAALVASADTAIVTADTAAAASIRTGARNGSEMGAFCRDGAALKERSLLVKYREYLPAGLAPVLVPMPLTDVEAETMRGRQWPPM
ncbi:hypothetical protein Cs7R123_48280 [Catellatospora sp. TT07R-123]|uniref:hypothetical protein n=1 Tax=Catellatospora sp. TT07R-123 TaxID=2733863 RepID=UPI001B2D0215|nr:hypothetical protein [Catellatospora sp. TT07R-123]GHJ47486.1 hypothetical protein Cs7R123_48280 [Catellatospora sp. TT07R-123]